MQGHQLDAGRVFEQATTVAASVPLYLLRVGRDLSRLAERGPGFLDLPVTDVMTREPLVARADELRDVLLNLLENSRLAGARNGEVHCARRDGRVVIDGVRCVGCGVCVHVCPGGAIIARKEGQP